MEQKEQTPKLEWPTPIAQIYPIIPKSTLYDLRAKGIIKFHYLGNKPFVYMSEINAAMVVKDIHR